jgi:hypothetical protein
MENGQPVFISRNRRFLLYTGHLKGCLNLSWKDKICNYGRKEMGRINDHHISLEGKQKAKEGKNG